jgi:hypothetical protein
MYRFKDHKWLATMDGSRIPSDVYYENNHLGVIESQPGNAYIIVVVSGPEKQIDVPPTINWNYFRTKEDAAKMLHHVWNTLRKLKS